jgi:hypothetical protein
MAHAQNDWENPEITRVNTEPPHATFFRMEQNGAAFDVIQGSDGIMMSMSRGAVTETCTVCHGPGRLADIELVHDFE